MKYTYYLFLILALTIGCDKKQSSSTSLAFIGGEIINPKTNFVIIDNPSQKSTDTITLDKNNRFNFNIKNLDSNLFLFRHGDEYQTIIVEPNDSLMLRLNTLDFDESLVFAGQGAKKNNYLVKVFLENEEESKKLMTHSQKEPKDFFQFVSKRRESQLNHFFEYAEKNDFSDYFENIIISNINYNNFADLEIYPFAYFGENRLVHIKHLPEYFYSFREHIDYNNSDLSHFYAYNRFLSTHIDNLSLHNFYDEANNDHSKFNRNDLNYNKSKINLIDQLIQHSEIKNRLLRFKTREFISINHSMENIEEFINHYKSISNSEKDITYIETLKIALTKLKPGNKLPDFQVFDTEKKEYQFSTIINKPTLIYFWSLNHKQHFIKTHDKVNELKQKIPNLEFISVNINDNHTEKWKETTKKYNFRLDKEFKLKTPHETLKKLAINYLNKVFVINKDKEILSSNINIHDKNIDEHINSLLLEKNN